MKYSFTILFLLFVALACNSKARTSSPKTENGPKELGEKVFDALKNSDFAAFQSLLMTKEDCATLLKNSTIPPDQHDLFLKPMEGVVEYLHEDARENFSEILDEAKASGIDWNRAELREVMYQVESKDGMQSTDIILSCHFQGNDFAIRILDCQKSSSWRIMGELKFRFR